MHNEFALILAMLLCYSMLCIYLDEIQFAAVLTSTKI